MKLIFLLTRSEKCILVNGTVGDQEPSFAITDTKFYVPVLTLSAHDNAKLLH